MTAESNNQAVPWFEDGNVIIAVKGNHFRVHRGVLTNYSTVFKDMFSCSDPHYPELPMIQDCPVIELHDSVTDIQDIFLAMYNRGYPFLAKSVSFSMISSFLRLGKKYLVRQLFEEAQLWLEASVWNLTTKDLTLNAPPSFYTKIVDQDKFRFSIINLAREVGLLSVLPIMLFTCAVTCPMQHILDGYQDGMAGFQKLSPENQRACLLGRDRLRGRQSFKSQWPISSKMRTSCSDAARCSKARDEIFPEIDNWADTGTDVLCNPFLGWKSKWELNLCNHCVGVCKSVHQKARTKLWDELPSTFGLAESWAELEKATISSDFFDETS